MRVLLFSSLLTLTAAAPPPGGPADGTNQCGSNERGLPRVAGDTWAEGPPGHEACNRCRCLDNLVPGCTRRFCRPLEEVEATTTKEAMFSELRSSETLPANQCGTNERGLPRQAGDTWMVDCNRCRCLDNLVPGCTRRFCTEDESSSSSSSSQTRTGNDASSGASINFPGASAAASTSADLRTEPVAVCIDWEGNQRVEGETWKQDCNTCGCGGDGASFCTERGCIPLFPPVQKQAQYLVTEDSTKDASGLVQCSQDGVQNCRAVTLDTSGLEEGQLVTLISGSEVEMIIKKVPADRTESRQHFQFQLTDGGEGSMTVNTETGGAYGSIKPLTGSLHYTLEAATGGGSVLYARSSDYFNQFED